ncbi:MAG: hypothetical protein U0Q22_09400 [Acidimicrobiales bacterium]
MSVDRARARQLAVIFLVSLAGLLLEVGYTRIVSYKLWYYYTYLVLGLALLGIGTGGVLVTMWGRVRAASTERVMSVCGFTGAASVAVGYLVVARVPVDTVKIWDYGTGASFKNLAVLGLISLMVFASFISLGVTISVILGRAADRVGKLYFADLIGAGLGCLVAIPLISSLGPPAVVMVAALVFAVSGLVATERIASVTGGIGVVLAVVLVVLIAAHNSLPDVNTEATKSHVKPEYSDWGPVFRIDVVGATKDAKILAHDGSYGSGIHRYDGDPASLTSYEHEARAIPFRLLGRDNDHTLIIGSAGGNEILAALHFGSRKIEGVELNPVTIGLLKGRYADFTGHLDKIPNVSIHQADGRSYLARSTDRYDLVWYVAPDSYAANNAASSGAFVLSESYLYTVEMIKQTLRHLTDDGIMVVQFGELDFEHKPNRTERYVNTAREAFRQLGVDDPSKHMVVAAELNEGFGDLSTIILKRTPLTTAEVGRVVAALPDVPKTKLQFAPGQPVAPGPVGKLASLSAADAAKVTAGLDRQVGPVTDDAPFFWHFAGFDTVLGDIGRPMTSTNPEDSIGERVLLLLLAIAVAYAAVFLLLPFAVQRRRQRDAVREPARGTAAVYFAALGLGFMLIEVTMIQRLTLLLGYPTYSLTVTLASILVSTGVGALLSPRLAARVRQPLVLLWVVLGAMAVFYQFGLDAFTDALLPSGLAVRVLAALLVLAPVGLCLGMFMPIGLGEVARFSREPERYVAWAWAVNGFFSVIGSVLTTILSMTFGFRVVMFLALVAYAAAIAAHARLRRVAPAEPLGDEPAPTPDATPVPA